MAKNKWLMMAVDEITPILQHIFQQSLDSGEQFSKKALPLTQQITDQSP